jgi:hypothetical protein
MVEEKDVVFLQKECALKGVKDQCRCKKCHNVRGRISTCVKNNHDLFAIKDITGEERSTLMAKAHSLSGNDLAKVIGEAIVYAKMRKETTTFAQTGEFLSAL